jgi:hypothetical protein
MATEPHSTFAFQFRSISSFRRLEFYFRHIANALTLYVTFMGLEAYLLQIRFKQPTSEEAIIPLLEEAGMFYLDYKSKKQKVDSHGDLYFEQRSNRGLTEAHVLTSPGDTSVDDFSLRFSILSPKTVIDQTFEFLQNLNALTEIEVYDTEIRNHIFRRLQQTGNVDRNFDGLNEEDDAAIDKLCIVSLNIEEFKRNELEIVKRQTVLDNKDGEIIEGGSATT